MVGCFLVMCHSLMDKEVLSSQAQRVFSSPYRSVVNAQYQPLLCLRRSPSVTFLKSLVLRMTSGKVGGKAKYSINNKVETL